MRPRIIFLVGPTGVGKSLTAVCLAKKINAEIISCDSMQVYKNMNIISQKPPLALRKKIKHHLLNIVPVEKEYNVADYQKQALIKVKDILKKGKIPVFVGGTGFYMSVLLDGIFDEKTRNKKIRARLYSEAKKYGKEKLYQQLLKIDPKAALKIHPNDVRRVVRALEVYKTSKVPISELQEKRKGMLDDYDVKIFCLNREREKLYNRIDKRVDGMFKQGLLREVKGLLEKKLSRTASQAIGIKEIKGYLRGAYDLTEARRLIKKNSRHYAKRQLTWFKRDKRIEWIQLSGKERSNEVTQRILSLVRR